jgi:hypothetical protein
MKNNPYKGKYYYWSPERLDILRQALLVSKDWLGACAIVKSKGIVATVSAMNTQAYLNHMERPLMKRGGYRFGIRNKTKGQGLDNWHGRNMTKNPNKIIYQDNKILKFLAESKAYGNKEVVIDIEDYDKIKDYRWRPHWDFDDVFYIWSTSKPIILHRVIMGITDKNIFVDHKNHNSLDNRKQNLRICTINENNANRKASKRNTSGYKGIYWDKRDKRWNARVEMNHKKICLGSSKNKDEAAKIYNNNIKKYHGEFAYFNIIPMALGEK